MAFENDDTEPAVEEAGPPPEESSNRAFLIVAGILVAILLLSLLCLGGYALIRLPQLRAGKATDAARAVAQSTQMAQAVAETGTAEFIASWTATPSPTTPATSTPTATSTPVVAPVKTKLGPVANTPDARTATMAALLTQVASNTTPVPTATLLPKAGFADELVKVNIPAVGVVSVGLPAFLGMFVVLVGVAFIARWLRKK